MLATDEARDRFAESTMELRGGGVAIVACTSGGTWISARWIDDAARGASARQQRRRSGARESRWPIVAAKSQIV